MKNYKGKFLLVPASSDVSPFGVVDNADGSLFDSCETFNAYVHKTLNCDLYETVTIQLHSGDRYIMLVDEIGLLKDKPINLVAWYLYSRFNPQAPIVGDALICKLCYEDFGEGFPEHDFCCLDDIDITRFRIMLR